MVLGYQDGLRGALALRFNSRSRSLKKKKTKTAHIDALLLQYIHTEREKLFVGIKMVFVVLWRSGSAVRPTGRS